MLQWDRHVNRMGDVIFTKYDNLQDRDSDVRITLR